MVTGAEAARLKGVSRQAVYEAIADGRLHAVRVGRIQLIRARDLAAWQPIGNQAKARAGRPPKKGPRGGKERQ